MDDTNKEFKKKQNFCIFCKKLKTNIARHFETIHCNEEDVQRFIKLPKGSEGRSHLITELRNKGNFEYNSNRTENFIVPRIKQNKEKQTEYVPCPKCKVYLSVHSLTRHYKKCNIEFLTRNEFDRNVKRTARSLKNKIHSEANQNIINKISPPLQEDPVSNCLRKDKLIVLFGNSLTYKYREHQDYMIRNKMRFLARYLFIVRNFSSSIQELIDLFHPKNIDVAFRAIEEIGSMDKITNIYQKPKNALEIVNLLKTCCDLLETLYIKEDNSERLKEVQRFGKLLTVEAKNKVNKVAHRDLCENKRKKNSEKKKFLPDTSDVSKFKNYLLKRASKTFCELKKNGFEYGKWKLLSELCLTYITVFNRRRPGEAQRILTEDFENASKLSDSTNLPELYYQLHEKFKKKADTIYKIFIRGKLHRTVPLLIPENIMEMLQYLHNHRIDACVSTTNKYFFGIPGLKSGDRVRTLEVCTLMRKFTQLAKLKNPQIMRTTALRKLLATKASVLNLPDSQIETLQDFMGHEKHIHNNFYRQETVVKDIMMSEILDDKLTSPISLDLGAEVTIGEQHSENNIQANNVTEMEKIVHREEPKNKLKHNNLVENYAENLGNSVHEPLTNYSSVEIQNIIGVQKTPEREEPEYKLQNNNLEKVSKKSSKCKEIIESDTESLEDSATEPPANYSSVEIQDIIGVQKTPEREEPEYHLRNNNLEKVRKKFTKYKEIIESDMESLEDSADEPSANYSSVEIQDIIGVQKTSERKEPEYHLRNNNLEKVRKKFSKYKEIFESDTESLEDPAHEPSANCSSVEIQDTIGVQKTPEREEPEYQLQNNNLEKLRKKFSKHTKIFESDSENSEQDLEDESSTECGGTRRNTECERKEIDGDDYSKIILNDSVVIKRSIKNCGQIINVEHEGKNNDSDEEIVEQRHVTPIKKRINGKCRKNKKKSECLKGDKALKNKELVVRITPVKTDKLRLYEEASSRQDKSEGGNIIQRRTWDTPERYTARKLFNWYIANEQMPSYFQCENAVKTQPALAGRTTQQLYTWIHNQIKATHYKSDRVKQTWSTPEKRVIRNIFKKYIEKESGPYPNHIECQEAIMKYPELRGRTVAKIKSFIQHQRLLFNKKNKQS